MGSCDGHRLQSPPFFSKASEAISSLQRAASSLLVDPTADLISVLKLRVLGELWFFAEAGY